MFWQPRKNCNSYLMFWLFFCQTCSYFSLRSNSLALHGKRIVPIIRWNRHSTLSFWKIFSFGEWWMMVHVDSCLLWTEKSIDTSFLHEMELELSDHKMNWTTGHCTADSSPKRCSKTLKNKMRVFLPSSSTSLIMSPPMCRSPLTLMVLSTCRSVTKILNSQEPSPTGNPPDSIFLLSQIFTLEKKRNQFSKPPCEKRRERGWRLGNSPEKNWKCGCHFFFLLFLRVGFGTNLSLFCACWRSLFALMAKLSNVEHSPAINKVAKWPAHWK